MRHVCCALAIVLYPLTTHVDGQSSTPLRLSLTSQTIAPGGVVRFRIQSQEVLSAATGRAFGRQVQLWPDEDSLDWLGLVAADLEAKPGTSALDVEAVDASGVVRTGSRTLTVLPKRFETRRLSVSPGFVNPPVAEAERIAREAERLATLFKQSTPRLWRGPFVQPVPGPATSSFGRLTVLNGERRGRHQGADFRAATGTPVHAPNAGQVVLAADLYFSGNTVVLDHGLRMYSLLAHLSTLDVKEGDTVAREDVVGMSGATGRVTGPHLHWAFRLGEVSVDPISLIAALTALKDSAAPTTLKDSETPTR